MTLPAVNVTKDWSQPADQAFAGMFTLQNTSGYDLQVMATADSTPPDAGAIGLRLRSGQMLPGFTLAELFPHVVGGATRIWLRCDFECKVYFSHG